MLVETENLSIKILRTDKMALRQLARSEGEPISVVVRRILRKELRGVEHVQKANNVQKNNKE